MAKNRGDTIVEVVVAVAIVSVVIWVLIRATTMAINNATFAKNQVTATNLARESLEDARRLKETLGAGFFTPAVIANQCTTPPEIISALPTSTRRRTCLLDAGNTSVLVSVLVNWDGSLHRSLLETTLTKW